MIQPNNELKCYKVKYRNPDYLSATEDDQRKMYARGIETSKTVWVVTGSSIAKIEERFPTVTSVELCGAGETVY